MSRMSIDERRRDLIDAAFRVIADHGVEGATTRRICRQAGMPLASFHYAFESRVALLCAVMETAVPTDVAALVDDVIRSTDLPANATGQIGPGMHENLHHLFGAFFELVKIDPGRPQATISLGMYANTHAELQHAGKRMYQTLFVLAARALEAAATRAQVRFIEPAEKLGAIALAGAISITLVYLSTGDDAAIHQIIDAVSRSLALYVDETATTHQS